MSSFTAWLHLETVCPLEADRVSACPATSSLLRLIGDTDKHVDVVSWILDFYNSTYVCGQVLIPYCATN